MYEKLEKLLQDREMNLHSLCAILARNENTKIAYSTLADWKAGRSKPKADKLKILADYFGVSIEYFLEE